jgi:hypothetical protein
LVMSQYYAPIWLAHSPLIEGVQPDYSIARVSD